MPGSSPGMTISRGSPHEILFLLAIADRKSTRLNSSHLVISYAVFCLKKKKIDPRTAGDARIDCPRRFVGEHQSRPVSRRANECHFLADASRHAGQPPVAACASGDDL